MSGADSERGGERLFVALELEEALLAALGAWGANSLNDPALRPVPVEYLHITLAFLGKVEAEAVKTLEEALRGCARPAPRLELLDPVGKGGRRRPHLFALPVRSAAAVALRAQVAERLAGAGLYEQAEQPYWPHVTVARVRRENGGRRRPRRVAEPPLSLPPTIREHLFDAVRLTLYRSELGPQGARYTPLTQIELPEGR
ncbi:MAG TPA: RNA 2',3'-cyclic phosphodiesterase [Solirubrobacterales bacterium]|nr:RNA 2',3'-cyclic phosphodiesterase [Solirubrobacterales bacterium]